MYTPVLYRNEKNAKHIKCYRNQNLNKFVHEKKKRKVIY